MSENFASPLGVVRRSRQLPPCEPSPGRFTAAEAEATPARERKPGNAARRRAPILGQPPLGLDEALGLEKALGLESGPPPPLIDFFVLRSLRTGLAADLAAGFFCMVGFGDDFPVQHCWVAGSPRSRPV